MDTLENYICNEVYEQASRASDGDRGYLGMSQIGDPCERKLWYGFRGYTPPPVEGRQALIFDLGNRVEDGLVEWLNKAGFSVKGRQTVYNGIDGFFRGHCDGIVNIDGEEVILELKSASDKRFTAFKTSGIRAVAPTYFAQVQCYMGYGNIRKAIFLVMNKNTCELYSELVYYDDVEFEAIKAKADRIIFSNDPPDKIYDAKCGNCEYRGFCSQPQFFTQTKRTCGTCAHMKIKDRKLWCTHQKHTFPITKWGISCDDKDIQGNIITYGEWEFRDCPDCPF